MKKRIPNIIYIILVFILVLSSFVSVTISDDDYFPMASEIQNLDITDPATAGQNVTVTFQGKSAAWQTIYYGIGFSTDNTPVYTDDWVVGEGGIYNSTMADISHCVQGGKVGIQESATPVWHDYSVDIMIPSNYNGDYYVIVIAREGYVSCCLNNNQWQDSASLMFTVSNNNAPTQSTHKVLDSGTNHTLNATDVLVPPTSFWVTINDADGDNMNITIMENSSGWKTVNQTSGSGLSNGTYSFTNVSWITSYDTTYYITFNVTDGTDWCNETYHFTTDSLVTTNATTNVEETTATLHGYLSDDGGGCNVKFQYGTTTGYGSNTVNQSKSTGDEFNASISSLSEGTLYHCRAVATTKPDVVLTNWDDEDVGNSSGTSGKIQFTNTNSPTYWKVASNWSKTGSNSFLIDAIAGPSTPEGWWNLTESYDYISEISLWFNFNHVLVAGGSEYQIDFKNSTGTTVLSFKIDAIAEDSFRFKNDSAWTTLEQTVHSKIRRLVVTHITGNQMTYKFYNDTGSLIASRTGYTAGNNTWVNFSSIFFDYTVEMAGQITMYLDDLNITVGTSTAYGSDKTFLTKPLTPTSFTATNYSNSQINLTWTKGIGADNTYIERNATGITTWARGAGTEIYNGTGTNYEDSSLVSGVTYYYQAWSYAEQSTLHQWSDSNASTNATTQQSAIDAEVSPLSWTAGNINIGTSARENFTFWQNGTNNIDITITVNDTNYTFVNWSQWLSFGHDHFCGNFTTNSWSSETTIEPSYPSTSILKSNFPTGNFVFGVRMWMPRTTTNYPSKQENFSIILTVQEHT